MANFVGLLSPTDIRAGVLQGTLPSSADAVDGTVVVKPTSITYGGTSATIGGNGTITCNGLSVLSVNGVFSSTYRNYMIVSSGYVPASQIAMNMRLRASGSDTTTSTYNVQTNSYGQGSARISNNSVLYTGVLASLYGGYTAWVFNPYAASSKGIFQTSAVGSANFLYYEYSNSFFSSTQYDGFTMFPNTGSMTCSITVYGLKG